MFEGWGCSSMTERLPSRLQALCERRAHPPPQHTHTYTHQASFPASASAPASLSLWVLGLWEVYLPTNWGDSHCSYLFLCCGGLFWFFFFFWLGLLLLFLSVSRVIQGGFGFAAILLPQHLGYYHISCLGSFPPTRIGISNKLGIILATGNVKPSWKLSCSLHCSKRRGGDRR